MEEEFRDIKGYEGFYQISNLGRVKAFGKPKGLKHNGRILNDHFIAIRTYKSGYTYCGLSTGGVNKKYKIHQLIARAFIPNPENKKFVDHINTIKGDNEIYNLRWVTRSENGLNPITRKRSSESKMGELNPMVAHRRKIHQLDKDTGDIIKTWGGVCLVIKALGGYSSGIVRATQSGHISYGYRWRYA